MRSDLRGRLAQVVPILRGGIGRSGKACLGVQRVPAGAEAKDRRPGVKRRIADVRVQAAEALDSERPRIVPVLDERGTDDDYRSRKHDEPAGPTSPVRPRPQHRDRERGQDQQGRRPNEHCRAKQEAGRRRTRGRIGQHRNQRERDDEEPEEQTFGQQARLDEYGRTEGRVQKPCGKARAPAKPARRDRRDTARRERANRTLNDDGRPGRAAEREDGGEKQRIAWAVGRWRRPREIPGRHAARPRKVFGGIEPGRADEGQIGQRRGHRQTDHRAGREHDPRRVALRGRRPSDWRRSRAILAAWTPTRSPRPGRHAGMVGWPTSACRESPSPSRPRVRSARAQETW